MARGKRPVSFRTRKLSLSAPMVLPWRRGGRVGRRRTTIPEGAPASVLGPLRHACTMVWARHSCESAAARFLRGGADVVVQPGVQGDAGPPGIAHLVQRAPA